MVTHHTISAEIARQRVQRLVDSTEIRRSPTDLWRSVMNIRKATLIVPLMAGAMMLPAGVTAASAAPTAKATQRGEAVAAVTPRYIVEVVDFYCGDESGIDWTGSDEPYWVTTSKVNNRNVRIWKSPVFGDVDSGDRRVFPTANRQNVFWPAAGHTSGTAGPIAFSTQLWEDDAGGSVAEVVDKTSRALDLLNSVGAPLGLDAWTPKVPSVVRNGLYGFFADDMMGSRTIRYTNAQLASRLPAVGRSFTESRHFSGNGGDLPFGIGGSPDYDLRIRVTRVA